MLYPVRKMITLVLYARLIYGSSFKLTSRECCSFFLLSLHFYVAFICRLLCLRAENILANRMRHDYF
ncbi:rCG63032 [Rattus norvegicus]|uniref:RCG63032 n=1 Tax=Rattus norvegicus TaxID=10116 RepID=A6HVM6_RAT|nr:rCG63032 [Rattus norvegicus]